MEKQIAAKICASSKSSLRAQRSNLKHKIINLAERPLTLGQLKSLFSIADLIISNDTGPRHIAVALQRKIVTLFGPNNPAWTDTGYENEIKIVGTAPCAPCHKPVCKKAQHFCMEAITVDMVYAAAQKLLENNRDKRPL
jgi:heptosyltransferase-2